MPRNAPWGLRMAAVATAERQRGKRVRYRVVGAMVAEHHVTEKTNFTSHRIVFMGTPHFALPTLHAIAASDHDLVACYTRPPKPSGRGRRETSSPVHADASSMGVPVLTPERFRDEAIVEQLASLRPDVIVVAAYGIILPKSVLDIPRLGCLNVHGSLLPRWRGAAPVQRALLAGDGCVGISIMQMDAGMDTGPIRLMRSLDPGWRTAGEVTHELAGMGAGMMMEVLSDLAGHPPVPQPATGHCIAAKLSKDDARLDFAQDAEQVARAVRAFNPAPGAWTTCMDERLAIHRCDVVEGSGRPGDVIDGRFTIACGRGAIRPTIVQRPSRKPVAMTDMLHGMTVAGGMRCI